MRAFLLLFTNAPALHFNCNSHTFIRSFHLRTVLDGEKTEARAINGFIPDCVVLFKNIIKDKKVSAKYKVALLILIGYLVFPIDIIPDFIPVVGQLDDAIIVSLTLRFVAKGAGSDLVKKYWPGPKSSLELLLKLARIN